ncbi:MAG TPA: methyltransferase domain-containing protein [Planctomycetota bacterium]|nr:methyltransferase domain-containing protein [Planctomycetota bacterium]
MTERSDLYDRHYSRVEADVYRAVRVEAFGEDLRQTSWITADECDAFCDWLDLAPSMRVLEVACGSGGVAARLAQRRGVAVTGIDANEAAVAAARAHAKALGLSDRLRFQTADANEELPFPDASFDAVFCNDAINHLADRRRVLADWRRVLGPRGRCLYTDPIVVTGPLTNAEIAARSSIGFFVFTPLGANEEALRASGFRVVRTTDVTENVAATSLRWRAARDRRRKELSALEGDAGFDGTQRFLATVHALSAERRLGRFAFLGEKEPPTA